MRLELKSDSDFMVILTIVSLPLFTAAGWFSAAFSLVSLAMCVFLLYDGAGGYEWGTLLIAGLVYGGIGYWCYTNLHYAFHRLRQPA
ncbi:hypothetical protein ABRP72_19810 [Pectobacterium carotovorum]|uniref:hypothetical protein n=1 Tax=Pectobacterium TaxID=122277 RepID=UPI0004FFD1CF|nr:hypothetical protein [Pectobacterium atrosepticum]KFX11063.1 hypothetical protein JV34_21710 [Pectobacterium atrosepticum]KMK87620.1 hypothetical protein KCQ_05251 [Pectobacterium atrosepticum ICMP 1526]QXE13094.1 hypothetical protein DCX48_00460 [Pectobacterium atrosepticum]